jgi:hypothetical protein
MGQSGQNYKKSRRFFPNTAIKSYSARIRKLRLLSSAWAVAPPHTHRIDVCMQRLQLPMKNCQIQIKPLKSLLKTHPYLLDIPYRIE